MKKKQAYKVFSPLLLIIGILLVVYGKVTITGAVIGIPTLIQAVASSATGFYLIILSLILFLVEKLEEKVRRDPNIRSFRRWLEKKENRKVGYGEARKRYYLFEKQYWKQIGEGSIKKDYENLPLKFVEDYLDSTNNKYGAEEVSKNKLVRTFNFQQAIRGHNLKEIDNAISKIDTGLGKEHKLTGNLKGFLAIRTSKGGRIIFKRESDIVYLENYLSSHDYNKLYV